MQQTYNIPDPSIQYSGPKPNSPSNLRYLPPWAFLPEAKTVRFCFDRPLLESFPSILAAVLLELLSESMNMFQCSLQTFFGIKGTNFFRVRECKYQQMMFCGGSPMPSNGKTIINFDDVLRRIYGYLKRKK